MIGYMENHIETFHKRQFFNDSITDVMAIDYETGEF